MQKGLYLNPMMTMRTKMAIKKIKKWMKQISKERIRQNSRELGKLSYNNPLIVINEMITIVKSYPNQIASQGKKISDFYHF